jgi:hypothetical protein
VGETNLLNMIAAWIAAARYERGVIAEELERTPRWRVRRRSVLEAKIEHKRLQERRVCERFLGGSRPRHP